VKQAYLLIDPVCARVDEPVTIRLHTIAPAQTAVIRAQTFDDAGIAWKSWARFRADTSGIIDVTTQTPIEGSYTGKDGMGLFWSMQPFSAAEQWPAYAKNVQSPLHITFTAEVAGQTIAQAVQDRYFLAPSVHRTELYEQGLVGTFFQSDTAEKRPAILLLGGSSGMLMEQQAALLASHGYCTLALTYFGTPGLKPDLIEVPLEYFASALQWLQHHAAVQQDKIGVIGLSKGAEAALLIATRFPTLKATVAYAPTAVIHEGLATRTTDLNTSSWSYQGKPLPFVSDQPTTAFSQYTADCIRDKRPLAFRARYGSHLLDMDRIEQASISVEQINGPILLIAGQDDQMWPSDYWSDMIALHQTRHARSGTLCDYGGTPAGNATASIASWHEMLRFLAACFA
jgi:dienelactone hydrolase